MHMIKLLDVNHVCTLTDRQDSTYVFYTGGIAGISDNSNSKADAKPLDGRTDEVQLDRN